MIFLIPDSSNLSIHPGQLDHDINDRMKMTSSYSVDGKEPGPLLNAKPVKFTSTGLVPMRSNVYM